MQPKPTSIPHCLQWGGLLRSGYWIDSQDIFSNFDGIVSLNEVYNWANYYWPSNNIHPQYKSSFSTYTKCMW